MDCFDLRLIRIGVVVSLGVHLYLICLFVWLYYFLSVLKCVRLLDYYVCQPFLSMWRNLSSAIIQKMKGKKKLKKFADCVNFISQKQQEAEKAKRNFDYVYEIWKRRRAETITKIGITAEQIKKLNDEMTAVQTFLKGLSMAGKVVAFCGPVTAVVGTATAITANLGYGACSAVKAKELERMCKDAQRTLEKDTEVTQQLFRLMNEMRTISEAVKECVKFLHSATVEGFFDVPDLLPFATAVKNIKNIDEPGGFSKFLTVLWEEMKILWNEDSTFSKSFSALRTFNPGVIELIDTVPEILVNSAIFASTVGSARPGVALPMGKVLTSLNILAIIADFTDIVEKVNSINEYPKLSMELLKIKRKLQEERRKIYNLKEDFRRKTASL